MRIVYVLTCVAVTAALILIGCSSDESQKPSQLNLFALDYSKSTLEIRGQLLARAHEFVTELDATNSNIIVFRFGNTTQEFYSGAPPEDEDLFAILLAKAAKGSDSIEGTNYPKLLKSLAAMALRAEEETVRVLIVGDGWNDYAGNSEADAEYRAAARSLAKNPKVSSITFWGVDMGAREAIREMFAGNDRKLRILSMDQSF